MKKFYALLAAVCLLSACSGGEAATVSETVTASETDAGETTVSETTTAAGTTAKETTTVTEITTAAETTSEETTTAIETATAAASDYTYNFAERYGDSSEEQDRLYEFFEENRDDTEIFKNIEDSRVQLSENGSDMLPGNYEIYSEEFFADFDGDGDGELYICRYTSVYPQSPWGIYQELWYTDGESCVQVDSSTGRGLFGGILKPLDGVPLMYIIPEIAMGSPVQLADVYIIKDGKPALYELPEGERFLYDGDRIFISLDGIGSDGYNKLLDALDETRDDPESFQTIGWVDGELKIISGYGKNGAEDT